MRDFPSLDFQNLPYHAINALLSLCLTNDAVHLSGKSHRHIFERHSGDYPLCMRFMETIISKPEYVGRTPRQDDNFEIMREASGAMILVALSTHINTYGKYPVLSSYIIDANTFNRRLRKSYVKSL